MNWQLFYDDYERGTAFIADEHGPDYPIADDLPYEKAKAIVDTHNEFVRRLGEGERLLRTWLHTHHDADNWPLWAVSDLEQLTTRFLAGKRVVTG